MSSFHEKEVKLIEEYEGLKPLLVKWGEYIDRNLMVILSKNGLSPQAIQIKPKHRIKENKSLIRRAFYRDIESNDPLKRIEDKVATRVVVTTLESVAKIREIILREDNPWKARESRSMEKHLKKPKEFDYQSLHLNLTPKTSVEEFRDLSTKDRSYYVCELQVRTLLQHAFAEVAHDTIYKGAFGADTKLVRILSRSMALMEATDEYFCKCLEIMRDEETYEKTFLSKLISIANDNLEITQPFNEKQVDKALTSIVFESVGIIDIDINDIEKTVLTEKEELENAINKTKTYLQDQPVIILILHLIIKNSYLLIESWHLEKSILEDLYYRMGYSLD